MMRRRIISIFLLVWMFIASGCVEKKAPPYVEEARMAPEFTLFDILKRPVKLSDFRGHIVMLHFWGSVCENCLDPVLYYNKMYKKYHPLGLRIIGVGALDAPKNIIAFTEKHRLQYPVLIYREAMYDLYHSPSLPTLFVINKDGTLLRIYRNTTKADLEKIDAYINLLTSI